MIKKNYIFYREEKREDKINVRSLKINGVKV